MSGEIVLAPVGIGVAACGGGVLIAGAVVAVAGIAAIGGVGFIAYGAGKAIKDIIDARVEAAVREMEAEKARITQWQNFQKIQQEQQMAILKQDEALRAIERKLSSIVLAEPATTSGHGPTGYGYVSVKKVANLPPIDSMREMLHSISSALDDAQESFSKVPDSPFLRLKKHLESLATKLDLHVPPHPYEITTFRETVVSTINHFMDDRRCIRERSEELIGRLDKLISDIVTTHALTDESAVRASLQQLQSQTMVLLEKESILPGQVDFIEKRLTEIRTSVEARLVNGAFRTTLAESLTRNLGEMGYVAVKSFSNDPQQNMMRAELRIPGGERLRMTIDRTNRMSFQVLHEARSADAKLTSEGKRHFRDQEKLWCQDMKNLIRKLTQEGFAYSIGHENLIPDMRIPVAVVEDADEIISRQNEAEVEMIRRRMLEDQARSRRMT